MDLRSAILTSKFFWGLCENLTLARDSPNLQEVLRQQEQLSTAAVDRDAALSRLLELEAAVAAAADERRERNPIDQQML